ncbi:hypothetical protein FOZ61_000041 [Perkinsus olseni]|uniref:Uncharacterized protein n=1 Tax=Perkinsus olseni TaxID=32597 RepID=A0A7J6MJ20_PEROL|nr:hypothetical protein FOZ61_000041 [Perkinsus olseni]
MPLLGNLLPYVLILARVPRTQAHFTCSRLRDGYCWQCRRNSQRAIDLFDWSPAFELRDGRTRTLMATKTVVLHGNGAVSGMEFFLSKGEVVNWTDEDQVRISDGGLLHLAGAFCFPTARRVWCDRSFDDREIYKPCTWACFVLANAEAVHPLSVRWQCLVRYNNKPFPKRIFSACVEHGTAQAINRFTLESSVAKTAE